MHSRIVRTYCYAIVVLLCVSCGPAAKLRRAQRLIDKAIADGAKVDTTWTNVKFVAPAVNFNTTITDPQWQDTVYFKDPNTGVEVKIKRVQIPGEKETVYVEGKCPPLPVEVPCPTEVKVSAGFTWWDMLILAIFCLAVGTFLGPVVVSSFRKKD